MSDLAVLTAEIRKCQLCQLAKGRTHAVPGEGPANADILFIGEGPGMNEDKQGRPFVGASGQFLTELISKAGYKREDVFIANVVKCRPPQNRDPLPEEISACNGYLDRQIAIINPKIIVTLGRFSMAKFFPGEKISAIHGKARHINGRVVVAMFHPAAALHNPQLRPALEQDFANLKQLISNAQQQAEKKPIAPEPPQVTKPNKIAEWSQPDEDAEQLSLF